MPIRWDPLLVRAVAGELDDVLAGARLRAIRLDGKARDLTLLFRDRSLVWRLHPNRGVPLLRDAVEPGPRDQRLRARLRRAYAPDDERIIVLELTGERSGTGPFEVIVELMGNQLNGIVTHAGDRTIRHVLRTRQGKRVARVGATYEPPPPTGRSGVAGDLSLEEWLHLLEPVPPPDRERELVRRVAWASPLNARTLLGDPGEHLAEGHRRWVGMVTGETTQPLLLHGPEGHGSLQPYPFPLVGSPSTPTPSLLEAFDRCAEAMFEEGDAPLTLDVGPDLVERIEDAIAHHERRGVRLQAELDGREDPVSMRDCGDLILSRYNEIASSLRASHEGASHTAEREVTLMDFAGDDVRVQLDPSLSPHENAEQYYDRAARSERAAERLPGLIAKAEADRARFEDLLRRARSGEVTGDEVRAALPPPKARKGRGSEAPALPYRSYRSSGGLEIRVGRGSRHNDDLTFRHSSPNDVWLHARHTAGAHVVLRWGGTGNPPARDLEEAGVLAALHSKARTSGSVPVDWTLRKYVRKPRGAPPGSVVPDRVKTIFVQPDEGLLEALADDD